VAVSLFLYVFVPRWLIEKGKAACNALPGFLPTLIGGQPDDFQFCKHRFAFLSLSPASYFLDLIKMLLDFVGYWPAQSSVVVAYQGTNPKELYVALIRNRVPTH